MKKKSEILIFVSHYLPGFMSGGPARSIANLTSSLDKEYNFKIFTRDRDFGSMSQYPNITPDNWIKKYGATVFYASDRFNNLHGITKQLKAVTYDLVYLNSVFSNLFSIAPLIIIKLIIRTKNPIVIAPRGEFSLAAMENKKYRKKIYLNFAKLLNLHKNIVWQASSIHEKSDIQREIGINANVIIARNIAISSSGVANNFTARKIGDPLRLIFISRISPKKNLDFALKILQQVKCSVNLSICGPFEDSHYWEKCRHEIEKLPPHVTTNVIGPVSPENIPNLMVKNDLLIFPTLGENFGHVIAESLAAGTPVLISDTTPWRGLEEKNAGADLPLSDQKGFILFIEKMAAQSESAALLQRACSLNYAIEQQKINSDVNANKNLFDYALNIKNQNNSATS